MPFPLLLPLIYLNLEESPFLHQDVVENVFGFIRVYPVFRVIGNLETGNPETGVSRGSAQNCLPTDCQRLRLLFSFFFFDFTF